MMPQANPSSVGCLRASFCRKVAFAEISSLVPSRKRNSLACSESEQAPIIENLPANCFIFESSESRFSMGWYSSQL